MKNSDLIILDWKDQSKRLLKSELVKKGLTTDELSILLSKIGINETKASIDNKISRGTFSLSFYLQCRYILDNLYEIQNKNNNVKPINDISIKYHS
ncbi:MAG: DUF6471 domain-containing protein [Bacteroidetes bacterium]|nr:DUF6471 domain-containing protein [Patescibacteria group bacterium]MCL5991182.1 DUF6471 domain-containing protein [Bacteroidota bacterium]